MSYRLLIKPALDKLLAASALVALAPLFGYLYCKIRMEDAGPIFYKHPRVGKGGRHFVCLKFRTMVPDADRLMDRWRDSADERWLEFERSNFKLKSDPRVTRIGKTLRRYSLDELPQLWNILKGEMSFVGPRPVTAPELSLYGEAVKKYLSLVPGLTGKWQVSGRSDTSFDFRVRCDVAYFEAISAWADFGIILRTVSVVLKGSGSY